MLGDLGVNLRGADALMAQELAYRLDGNIVFQSDGSRKGMAGRMGR